MEQRSPFSFEVVDPVNEKPINTQLFENSPVAVEPATDEYLNSPDRLHNDDTPRYAIIEEKPWHRIVCYLVAQGLPKKEIAARVDKTEGWIGQLTRQPWFRLRLIQELKEAGLDAVQQVLKGSALDSIYTLVELRDDEQTPKAVRRAAADSLLDRFLGKATQKIELDRKPLPSSEEISTLDKEIKQLENELNP